MLIFMWVLAIFTLLCLCAGALLLAGSSGARLIHERDILIYMAFWPLITGTLSGIVLVVIKLLT